MIFLLVKKEKEDLKETADKQNSLTKFLYEVAIEELDEVEEKIKAFRAAYNEEPHVIWLQNHGIFVAADTIEEERRLAYVGITRARETLAFTFAAKRKQYGEIIDCAPSRFLDELPPDDLAWEGNDDTPTEVKAVRGNTALADIRAMLKR